MVSLFFIPLCIYSRSYNIMHPTFEQEEKRWAILPLFLKMMDFTATYRKYTARDDAESVRNLSLSHDRRGGAYLKLIRFSWIKRERLFTLLKGSFQSVITFIFFFFKKFNNDVGDPYIFPEYIRCCYSKHLLLWTLST